MTFDPDLDLDPLEEAVAARLGRTLTAVAAATPTPDRSAAIVARIDAGSGRDAQVGRDAGEEPVEDEGDTEVRARPGSEGSPSPRRTLWWAAAVFVVVAAVAGAVAVRSGDGAVDEVRATPGPAGTGWYLPPSGWEVVSVDTDFLDNTSCPCTFLAAVGPGAGADRSPLDLAEVALASERVPDDLGPVGEAIEVGGRPGRRWSGFGGSQVMVPFGDRALVTTVLRRPADMDVALALMDAWLDRREAGEALEPEDLPWPEGWVHSEVVERLGLRSEQLLVVHARERATGRLVEYQLVPTGFNRWALVWPSSSVRVDGEAFHVTTVDESSAAPFGGPHAMAAHVGGPVDVVVGDSFFGEKVDALDAAEADAFLDGLREVTTEEWRAALAPVRAEVDADVLKAPSLFDPPLVQG